MKKVFSKEVIIGLSVIVALAILFIGIDYLKGINIFKPANFYVANYKNVAGLEISAPVNIEGFKVGQVREINFNYSNPGEIEVVMALNKNLRLPKDTKAVIASGLLNGAYVDLKLGNSPEKLEVGGELAGVLQPDLMSSLSDGLMPSVSEILPKVDSLLSNVNKLVADPALVASLQNIKSITESIDVACKSLNYVISKDMPNLVRNANGVLENVDSITADLSVLSTQLKSLPINSTMENVDALADNLAKFSNQLNDRNSTLGMLMNDPGLYDNLHRVTADIDSLIVDIKKNPKRYISIKLL